MKPIVELISITPNAEKVIEQAGRTSYQSFDRITENSAQNFIQMLIKRGHLSVLEHAYATFRLKNVSRALTHQLVRHRLASYTQKSQRYVDESNFEFIIPPSIKKNDDALKIYSEFMKKVKKVYKELRKKDILKEDARYVLPNATVTEIVITANMREYRHIFKLRCSSHAQWEIREVAIKMLKILKEKVPSIFADFQIDEKNMTATTIYPD